MVYSAQQIGIYGGMIVSYITMEIWTGIWILVRLFPMALIIFAGVMIIEVGIEFIQKKKIEVIPLFIRKIKPFKYILYRT